MFPGSSKDCNPIWEHLKDMTNIAVIHSMETPGTVGCVAFSMLDFQSEHCIWCWEPLGGLGSSGLVDMYELGIQT